ncbi:unnamed protein product [Bursaphelenchus okinawaensis]|uniref:Uncharacterized protein n=1 Tax=Bursaphelenchus okinawaensis TaxID=465554 RepID=A0A811LES8_9BILA|nr:unnamed protein product [Bursaphelenchus okinawaensis]CAG9121882.1 unnamed protein product [Bursaphelenchus okinawaensis]
MSCDEIASFETSDSITNSQDIASSSDSELDTHLFVQKRKEDHLLSWSCDESYTDESSTSVQFEYIYPTCLKHLEKKHAAKKARKPSKPTYDEDSDEKQGSTSHHDAKTDDSEAHGSRHEPKRDSRYHHVHPEAVPNRSRAHRSLRQAKDDDTVTTIERQLPQRHDEAVAAEESKNGYSTDNSDSVWTNYSYSSSDRSIYLDYPPSTTTSAATVPSDSESDSEVNVGRSLDSEDSDGSESISDLETTSDSESNDKNIGNTSNELSSEFTSSSASD